MGGLLIRPLISKLPINSCTADHQHRTSSLSSLRSPAETSKTPSGEKKKSTKPGAKDGGRNFVQLPMPFPVPHLCPRAAARPRPARFHPAARGGAERPLVPTQRPLPLVSLQPRGLGVSPFRPFPPLSCDSWSQNSFSRKTNPFNHLFFFNPSITW